MLEGVHSWALSLLFKNILARPKASAGILFCKAHSCCANEVKSDLPVHFSGFLLSSGVTY